MTYTADSGAVSAAFHPGAEAEQAVTGPGTIGRFVAPGSVTQGRFGLYEWRMAACAGGGWVDASAGDFLHVPEGGVHGFRNDSDAPATMLILFAPGAPRETYFRELADISSSGRVLSDEEWTDLFARHDQYRAT